MLVTDVQKLFNNALAGDTLSINEMLHHLDAAIDGINNNMNTVMRTLTSVSIILMFPTLIASLFGMNLINGMEDNKYGFIIAMVLSAAISGLFWWIFRHKRLI